MTLAFPNLSRSYDADRQRVRFWGYDDTLEIPFFVELGAIFRLYPNTTNVEAGILAAFDAARARIVEAAANVYSRGRRSFYVLASADFS